MFNGRQGNIKRSSFGASKVVSDFSSSKCLFPQIGFIYFELLHDSGQLVDVGQRDDNLRERSTIGPQLASQDLHVAGAHVRNKTFRRFGQIVAGEERQQDQNLEHIFVRRYLTERPDQPQVVHHFFRGQDRADSIAIGHLDLLDLGHFALRDGRLVVLSPLVPVALAEQELELLISGLAASNLGEAARGRLCAALLPDRVLEKKRNYPV